jgi:hypothetical protein
VKRYSPLVVLGSGLLLGLFRIAASAGDFAAVTPGARTALSILGTAGTTGIAIFLAFLLAPRADWARAVFLHGAAAQALGVAVRIGARMALGLGPAREPVAWALVAGVALVSGALFGAVLVGFAWALRRFGFVHVEDDAPPATSRRRRR